MIKAAMIAVLLSGCAHKRVSGVLYPDSIPSAPEPVHELLAHADGDLMVPMALRAGECIELDAIAIPPVWVLQCSQVKLDSEYWRSVYIAGVAARVAERELATDYAAELRKNGQRRTAKAAIIGGAAGLVGGAVAWEIAR